MKPVTRLFFILAGVVLLGLAVHSRGHLDPLALVRLGAPFRPAWTGMPTDSEHAACSIHHLGRHGHRPSLSSVL